VAAIAYQVMVAACGVAGGVSRCRLITSAYEAVAISAKLTAEAMAPLRGA
jgi:hypothetical protein